MQDNGAANILKHLPPSDYAHARRVIIHMILATDMSQHTEHCSRATKLLHRAKHLKAAAVTASAHCNDDAFLAATSDNLARRRSHYGISTISTTLRFQRHSCDGNASRRGSVASARSYNNTGSVAATPAVAVATDSTSVTTHAGVATGPVHSTQPLRYSLFVSCIIGCRAHTHLATSQSAHSLTARF
jgi:3'5'-cyclic nucleotide phosphodiesterase